MKQEDKRNNRYIDRKKLGIQMAYVMTVKYKERILLLLYIGTLILK